MPHTRACLKLNPKPQPRQVFQYAHACEDLVFHLLHGGSWKGVEDTLTSLKFIENKCRAVDPFHLQTDYSAALDSHLVPSPPYCLGTLWYLNPLVPKPSGN